MNWINGLLDGMGVVTQFNVYFEKTRVCLLYKGSVFCVFYIIFITFEFWELRFADLLNIIL